MKARILIENNVFVTIKLKKWVKFILYKNNLYTYETHSKVWKPEESFYMTNDRGLKKKKFELKHGN